MKDAVIRCFFVVIAILGSTAVFGQDGGSGILEDQSLADARDLLQAGRADIVREDLRMTEAESSRFWPVYEEYRTDIMVVRNRQTEMIADFLKKYQAGELTDSYATWLIEEHFEIKSGLLKVQQKYLRKFRKVLPELKVARFYHLENKMDAETDAQLALFVPLVEAL